MRLTLKMAILTNPQFRTQRAFARACGRTDDWISRIINGIRSPSEEERKLIISVLGLTDTAALFKGTKD